MSAILQTGEGTVLYSLTTWKEEGGKAGPLSPSPCFWAESQSELARPKGRQSVSVPSHLAVVTDPASSVKTVDPGFSFHHLGWWFL